MCLHPYRKSDAKLFEFAEKPAIYDGRSIKIASHFWERRMANAAIAQAMDRAVSLDRDGQSAAAEEVFRRFINENPDCADAHHTFALSLSKLGRMDEAIAEFQKA